MKTLKDLIDEAAQGIKNDQLAAIKVLRDFNKITSKEYYKILKRIYGVPQKYGPFGLEECSKTFVPVQVICAAGLENQEITLTPGIEIIANSENYGK